MAETYTGVVMEVGQPEMSKDGTKERPRKIVISDKPDTYQGKTFRCWVDRDYFQDLQRGAHVTVHYEVQPNRDPSRRGSNMIEAVQVVTGGGANGTTAAHTSVAPTGTAPSSGGFTDEDPWEATPNPLTDAAPVIPTNKDDYWEQKEAKDEDRNRRMAAAWAISQSIALGKSKPDEIHDTAHKLLVLQDRIVSEIAG